MLTNNQNFWNKTWDKYADIYTSSISRQAYYLYFLLPDIKIDKILELGAGSYRDTAKLNEWGYECHGIDFSKKAHKIACQNYPDFQKNLHCDDAFNLKWLDKTFDITFHNGFFVCFEDNQEIKLLLKEQVRVTKKIVVCTVHNSYNQSLIEKFKHKSHEDSLYKIRFFKEEELLSIMNPYFKRVEIIPFGLQFFDRIMRKIPNRYLLRFLYKQTFKYWNQEKCERLMFIGYL